jgi:hypothetical protein
MKEVFTVVQSEGYEKPFWVKIGVAFENSDGSLNVRLNVLPVNKEVGSGLAIIHLIDSNVFIPIGPNAKVFLNLAPQSFQKFCQAKKDRLFHFLRRDSLWDVADPFSTQCLSFF